MIAIFKAFGILLFVMAAYSTRSAWAQSGNYYGMVEEIKQWHRSNPDSCGKDTSACGVQHLVDGFESCNNFRIVNGCDVTEPSTLGWQVAVNIGPALCSGTLVSSRHVVLAAHCVKPQTGQTYPASSVTVLVGALNIPRSSQNQRYGADAYAAHPQYTPHPANTNDAAIVKLNRDVTFTSNGIRPACLPSNPTQRTFTKCMVGGYGISNVQQHSGAGTLRYAVLQAVSDEACLNLYGPSDRGGAYNKAVSFCALGKHHGTGSDTCVGDSGSGLMCKDASSGRWSLQGIVSYGPQECGQQPGVYAEAYVLGFQMPAARALKSDQCSAGSISASGGFGSGSSRPSFSDVPASTFGGFPSGAGGQFGSAFGSSPASSVSQIGFGVKKAGGLATTATETIRKNGCTSNDQCQSNACKQVELCVGFGPANHFRALFADFLLRDRAALLASNGTNSITNGEEDEDMMKKLSFVEKDDKRCARASICWTSTWLSFYKDRVPTFEF